MPLVRDKHEDFFMCIYDKKSNKESHLDKFYSILLMVIWYIALLMHKLCVIYIINI